MDRYRITDQKILDALLEARGRGVSIRIITDKMMALTPLQQHNLKLLKKAGALIKKNRHPGFMHLKMTITDNAVATFASANFTKSSQNKNDEGFLVIKGGAAAIFEDQFKLMWENDSDFRVF